MKPQDQKRPVLQDHKKVGQRLIPPFVAKMPGLGEVSFVKQILPEILWIEVITHQAGYERGTGLTVAIAKAANDALSRGLPCFISSYPKLTIAEQNAVVTSLQDRLEISKLLSPLVAPYPECPLAFLCTADDKADDKVGPGIEKISEIVSGILDRMSRKATMMQAGAVYVAFSTGRLSVAPGLSLSKLPEIAKYPDTELSLQVAASVRGSLNVLAGANQNDVWPRYFWNHGLELVPCRRGTP